MPVIDSSKGPIINQADTNKSFPDGSAPWQQKGYRDTLSGNDGISLPGFSDMSPTASGNIPTQGLADFMSLVREKGLASHNHYFVNFDIPKALQKKYMQYGSTLSLLCAGGEFPATSFETREVFWQGATKPMATSVKFGPMFLFFYLEQDMTLKTFIDDWLTAICNPVDGIVGFNDDYSTSIRIYQLDKQFKPTYAVQLVNAFPNSTYPLQITYQGGQIHRLPVSFQYRYWENIHVQYSPNVDNGFWGNLLSSMGMGLVNKIAPVIYGSLMK